MENYKPIGYDSEDKETENSEEAEYYEGDIVDYYSLNSEEILVKHGGRKLVIYRFV